jgi:predicted 2-oxoglutarate/Fe(II)-dependent dioxygenase YbiX
MIASARPARFGRGEQTLMDLSVRDTWEIPPDRVTLTGLDWDAILAEVRDELGLPARARLRAEPHALLVYGKGQFFLPHQDSEKDDTIIGTLVVSLPSSHTGGELVIEHNDKTVTYQASADEVSVAVGRGCPVPHRALHNQGLPVEGDDREPPNRLVYLLDHRRRRLRGR